MSMFCFFFFQAEDGIRYLPVTGVQTCALPIFKAIVAAQRDEPLGRDRAEPERFIALRSHYGFDGFFCIPGKEGAHEKGGVEGEIGRFRRRHLVPLPAVASLAELNQLIAAGDLADDTRVITGRPVTIAAAFPDELPHLMPLPGEPFDPARLLQARVDKRGRGSV